MAKLWRPATHFKSILNSSFPRTLTTFSIVLSPPHLSSPKTLILPKFPISPLFNSPNLTLVCCLPPVSPFATTTFEWNEPIACSEVVESTSVSENDNDDDTDPRPYIPVRAFFFSTRFSLLFQFCNLCLVSFSGVLGLAKRFSHLQTKQPCSIIWVLILTSY